MAILAMQHERDARVTNKRPEPDPLGMDGSGRRDSFGRRSTDEHLILCVSLINGLRHWRYENFEAAAEARHNRR